MEENKEYVDINLYEDSDTMIISNPAHLFLQEIELSIKIGVNEIWGVSDYIDLRRYLFSQYITLNKIKNDIKSYVLQHCSQATNFEWEVDAEIYKDLESGKELLHIIFTVNDISDNREVKKYVQKFAIV